LPQRLAERLIGSIRREGGETASAIGLAVWSALIVSNVDNILRPILVGGDTEMPDIIILVSTLGGLAAFGSAMLTGGSWRACGGKQSKNHSAASIVPDKLFET
jgi:hypothetical protein